MTWTMQGLPKLAMLPLAQSDPLAHVLDGRLFFDESGALWRIGITKQTFMFFLAGILTLLFFGSYSRQAGKTRIPSRWGNFVEFIVSFVRDQMTRPFMGRHGDKYVPLIVSFFVFIATANLLGLVPFFDFLGSGGNTATGNLGITGALAICSFVCYHAMGIREQGGIVTYFKNLFPPVPIFVLPIIIVVELAAHVIKPCALAIRLFANMLAGHTLVAAILGFTYAFTKDFFVPGALISVASVLGITVLTFLELLVALIQAFVFCFLTTVFLSIAVHPEH
jgi:F-type H+-transporting ATPase subunit a